MKKDYESKDKDLVAQSQSQSQSQSNDSIVYKLFGGFAGVGSSGSYFESPEWVDTRKKPGLTSLDPIVMQPNWWVSVVSGKDLFFSLNFIWLMIAICIYTVFPYDLDAARSFNRIDWVLYRFTINTTITFLYGGFWHAVLYWFSVCKRPFHPNRVYRIDKLLHNMWYSFLGVVQYTMWESIVLYCYATNRISFLSDQDAFTMTNPWNALIAASSVLWVVWYREFHFYFAHRFIHFKALYKFVHSVHHRNADVEPFAGLCMHPIEHLYYFACLAPSLVVYTTPFALLWNGVHLLLSPLASHSGWEDHSGSDQYHYLHHRFFECNYGTVGTPYDKYFGTFRDKLTLTSSTYKGGAEDMIDDKVAAINDAKATIYGLPDIDTVIYNTLNLLVWFTIFLAVRQEYNIHTWSPHILAFVASFGPVVLAQVMDRSKRSLFYPFHKETYQRLSFHILVSTTVCIVPVYILVHSLLAAPGKGLIKVL